LQQLKHLFGPEINIEVLVNLPAVASSEKDPFVHAVYRACNIHPGDDNYPRALPYLTDGAVLQSAFNGAPTIILGPGQPEMAHKTDEFCLIKNLEDAVTIYKKIILDHD
jgi:succinyl-diaminopimelate desuccinylase